MTVSMMVSNDCQRRSFYVLPLVQSSGQPDNKLGEEHFLLCRADGLNDVNVTTAPRYLCELDIDTCTLGRILCCDL